MAKETDKDKIKRLERLLEESRQAFADKHREYNNALILNEQLKRDKIALLRTLHILTEGN